MITGDVSAIAAWNAFSFAADDALSRATTRMCGAQRLTCFTQAAMTAFGQQTRILEPPCSASHRLISSSVVRVLPLPMPWCQIAHGRLHAQAIASSWCRQIGIAAPP